MRIDVSIKFKLHTFVNSFTRVRMSYRKIAVGKCVAEIIYLADIGFEHLPLLFGCVGFALGPVYPVMISLAGQRFPHARGTAAGLAAGAGALGGFAIPWLTGFTGDGFGIAFAMGSLGLWALVIAAGGEAARRSDPVT